MKTDLIKMLKSAMELVSFNEHVVETWQDDDRMPEAFFSVSSHMHDPESFIDQMQTALAILTNTRVSCKIDHEAPTVIVFSARLTELY